MIISDGVLYMKEEFIDTQTSLQIWNYCKRNPILPHLIFFGL